MGRKSRYSGEIPNDNIYVIPNAADLPQQLDQWRIYHLLYDPGAGTGLYFSPDSTTLVRLATGGGAALPVGTVDKSIIRWDTGLTQWLEFTAFILPLVDGALDQIMQTDGAGVVSWVDPPSGIADGTILHATLRWDGTDWVESDHILNDPAGDITIQADATVGFVNMDSPIIFGSYTGVTGALYGFSYTATENIIVGFVGGGLNMSGTISFTDSTFIYESFRGAPFITTGVNPGFAAYTVLQALPNLIAGSGVGHNPLNPLIVNAGPVMQNDFSGSRTVNNALGLSFSPQLRTTLSGAVMTATAMTGLRVSPKFSTVAGSSISFGTIRGLHCQNPTAGLFQPGAGTEAMAGYIGVDVAAISFGGNVLKIGLRSAISAATNARFIQNIGTAAADFGSGDAWFADNTMVSFGNLLQTPDAAIYYDTTDLIINPQFVPSPGKVRIPLGGLIVEGDIFPVSDFIRRSATTNLVLSSWRLTGQSSNDMVDGFGTALFWTIEDDAAVKNNIAYWSAERAGADNSGLIRHFVYTAGVAGQIFEASGNIFTVNMDMLAEGTLGVTGAVVAPTFNAVPLTAAGVSTNFLDETGAYSVPTGLGGQVDSVSGGTNINVTGTAVDPIVNLDVAILGVSVNGVTLSNAGAATSYLDETGAYSVPPTEAGFAGLGIWRYQTATGSSPSSGRLQFDNVTIDSATELYINVTNDDGTDMTNFLALLESGDLIYIQVRADSSQFVVCEVDTSSLSAGVFTFPLLNIEGQGSAPSNNTRVAVVGTSSGSVAGGQVDSVVGGTNITVNAADPVNPIVNLDAALLGVSVNGVTLSDAGAATSYLDETGAYSVPVGTVPPVDSVFTRTGAVVALVGDYSAFYGAIADVTANTAKVTNATHSGQMIGATALAADVSIITAQPAAGALVGGDTFLVNDGGLLREIAASDMSTFFVGSGINATPTPVVGQFAIWDSTGATIAGEPLFTLIGSQFTMTGFLEVTSTVVFNSLFYIRNRADAGADVPTFGQAWYDSDDDRLKWTPDTGVDNILAYVSELGGQVDSVSGGTNIGVTGTAADPIVNLDAAITGVSVNGVTLNAAGAATNFLNETGAYSVPPDTIGIGGAITNNQIAFGAATPNDIEGEAGLTWDGSILFTDGNFEVQNTAPYMELRETDAVLNEKVYRWRSSAGNLFLTGYTDADAIAFNVFQITRAASVVTEIDIQAQTVDIVGNLELSQVAYIAERAAALGNLGGFGQLWAGTDQSLNFTDDVGFNTILTAPASAPVDSVFTRTGAVVALVGDYSTFYGAIADVTANTAKVTNATHTGQIIGATALTATVSLITAQPASGALIGADTFLVNDGGLLRESTMNQLATFIGASSQTPWTSDIDGAGFGLDNIDRLEIEQPGGGDSLTITLDGTDIILAGVGNSAWQFTGGVAAQRYNFDAGGKFDGNLTLDSTITTILMQNASTLRNSITSLAGSLIIDVGEQSSGNLLRIIDGLDNMWEMSAGGGMTIWEDNADVDSINIRHTGTEAIFTFVGAPDVEFQGGIRLQIFQTSSTNAVQLSCVVGVARISTSSGVRLRFQEGGVDVGGTQLSATGVTSQMFVRDHASVDHDIGFNDLRIFNDNVSDTLEAQHAGQICFKDASTVRTLTLAASGNLDFPIETLTTVLNAFTSGNYIVNEGSGTTLYVLDGSTRVDSAGGITISPGGVVNIWRESATVYYCWGSGITP